MNLALFLVATGFLTGASSGVVVGAATAGVSITSPLALGLMNSGSSSAAITGVASVRITQSMA